MNNFFGSNAVGTRLAIFVMSASMLVFTTAIAQDEAPKPYETAVFELLLESLTQKPASEATATERASAADELTRIYQVSNLPRAKELAQAPQLRAQIELQSRALVYNAFANDFMIKNQPTEQEIFDVYQDQVALSPPREFKARHILVDTQSAAVSLIDQLKDGADFVELAKANSTGPSAESGGDLGWFTAQAMVKPFSDAVADMEDGAYTQSPVQTQFGWHVILRESSRESAPPPLDSVRDVIVQRISQQKFQDFVASLPTDTAD